jgi:hypothetical protein
MFLKFPFSHGRSKLTVRPRKVTPYKCKGIHRLFRVVNVASDPLPSAVPLFVPFSSWLVAIPIVPVIAALEERIAAGSKQPEAH